MKRTITLPAPIFEAGDQLAERLGRSRSKLVSLAVEQYVKAHPPADEIRHALDLVYADEPLELDEGLAQLQWTSLEKGEGSAPW